MRRTAISFLLSIASIAGAGCKADSALTAPPPTAAECPAGLPVPATCYRGEGVSGAAYVIVMPTQWNGTLVLFNRGATPVPLDSARALGAARLLLRDGTAVAASAYRSATPLARHAAEDTEELRRIFVAEFGRTQRTLVYGLSFGGLVTAHCMERYRTFDGGFAGCGLVAGALRSYYPLFDLRVVYQYYCQNLPRPQEAQYQLFLGLDPESPLTPAEVRSRINECTGISLPAAQRTEQQRENLANIVSVARIPENALLTNLDAATVLLRILVHDVLNGQNPLDNMKVRYTGSTDDAALNAGVPRYAANAQVAAAFATSDDPTGHVVSPVITLHAIDDSRAYVENESAYRQVFERAGTLRFLFQAYTNQGGHCLFSQPESLAVFEALMKWIDTGTPPTAQDFMSACDRHRAELGGACRFNPTFQPGPLEARIYPRAP
ncbi:MAG: hypothetical protein L0271_10270 [Gemmatimonadetes bacterium]|nr:hypothetical protein [Gemmatimonadota bacterium]